MVNGDTEEASGQQRTKDNINKEDKTKYCWLFVRNKIITTILLEISNAIIAIINSVIAFIFQYLGEFLVKHTTIETQVVSFSYILTLEFISMGIIMIVKAFDPSGFI